jgi:hypothetical protein
MSGTKVSGPLEMRETTTPEPLGRTLYELAAGGAAAVAVALFLPLSADDPFRSTVVILPLVVAALRALDRSARARGARTLGAARRVEAPLLIALLILTVHRQRLGLAATDWFLAAGYLLVFANRVTWMLVGWRTCLGRRLPRRPPAIFFGLPLVCYLAVQPWMSTHRQPDGDEPFYLLLTHSVAYDFDTDLADNYENKDWQRFMTREIKPQMGDPLGPKGEMLSRHTLLLPIALAPAYRLAGRWGAMAMMALFAALTAWMTLRLAHHYVPSRPGAALLAYSIFAFSPPFLLYSYQIWIEVPAALLVTMALDRILVLRHHRPWRLGQTLALAVPLALLPLLKLRLGLLALPLLFLAWLRGRPGKKVMTFTVAGAAAVFGGLLLYNTVRFGNPLKMHSLSELTALAESPAAVARGALGMFYDSAFGLFPSAPIWLLVLPGLWLAARRRSPQLLDLAVIAAPYLVAIWPRSEWFGGWSPPFRYPLALLPLLALLTVPVLAMRSRAGVRTLIVSLGGLTFLFALLWVIVPGWTFNFADGQTLLLDHAGSRFGIDLARFFPSTVRPRMATWVWAAASLALIPIALGIRHRSRSPIWGVTAVLLASCGLALAATRWPTTIVEVEDGYVRKGEGLLRPPLWVVNRPSQESGWAMPIGHGVSIPVVAGGPRVKIEMRVRFAGNWGHRDLVIRAGDAPLARQTIARDWQQVEVGPVDWPAGAPLVIVAEQTSRAAASPDDKDRKVDRHARVIVDRVLLDWSPGG